MDSRASARSKSAAKAYEKILTLPVPMRDSKMLLKLLRLHLQVRSAGRADPESFLAAEPAAPARRARRIISSQFARSGKIGADHRAAGKSGGRFAISARPNCWTPIAPANFA